MISTDNSTVEVFTDMTNEEYHGRKSHKSRTQVARYRGVMGGRAQRFAEVEGRSLFSGNASTTFGSLVDGAFEAECRGIDWRTRCAVAPPDVLAADGSRRGKPFQAWRASLAADAIECSAADFEKTGLIIKSILEHKKASELVSSTTHTQFSVFRTDKNGHRVKARADGVTPECWYDLKTTSSEWHELKWSFRRFHYDWQAAWYSDSAYACGWAPFVFRFIVVQTFPPFDVQVVRLKEEHVDRARVEIDETLYEIRRREETGIYVADSYHEEQELDLG